MELIAETTSPLTKEDLERAFNEGHFATVFQPKLSLIDGRTLGVETYIRWHHPEMGTLLPGEFLSTIAQYGRMDDLTDLVLHEAARVASIWRSENRHWAVAVNLSGEDLENPGLSRHLSDLFTAYAIPAEALSVDVSEACLAFNTEHRLAALKSLREAGISVALDANGIHLLPSEKITASHFSELKIGGSALISFARSVSCAAGKGLIAERLQTAARHGLTITATRVESIDTVKPLSDMGFSAVQGSFFRHPDTYEGLKSWSSDWLLPVLANERPPRSDTLARARADLADPDLLLLPNQETPESVIDNVITLPESPAGKPPTPPRKQVFFS